MLVKLLRKGKPYTLLVGMEIGTITIENSTVIFQKTKNRTISNPTSGYVAKKRKSESQRYLQHYSHHRNMETP